MHAPFAERIGPGVALRPGRADARNLLIVWYVRKSFYALAALGIIGATLADVSGGVAIDWSSPRAVEDRLLSPVAGLVLALVARVVSNLAALFLAYPLARGYEVGLEPRTNFGHTIGVWFDQIHLARAYRELRWTHHVRQLALARFGEFGRRVSKLDPAMDIANIALWTVAVILLITTAGGG